MKTRTIDRRNQMNRGMQGLVEEVRIVGRLFYDSGRKSSDSQLRGALSNLIQRYEIQKERCGLFRVNTKSYDDEIDAMLRQLNLDNQIELNDYLAEN
jgi:hypothetical protein